MPARILQLLHSGNAIIIRGGGSAPSRVPAAQERLGAGRRASDQARKVLRELIALRKEGKRN